MAPSPVPHCFAQTNPQESSMKKTLLAAAITLAFGSAWADNTQTGDGANAQAKGIAVQLSNSANDSSTASDQKNNKSTGDNRDNKGKAKADGTGTAAA
ncbi:MAG: hypothetical protein ABI781_04270, partial [Burkholderiales bacterium]